MRFWVIISRGRRRVSATPFMFQLASLASVLVVCSFSMVVAAEKQGFVVLPNTAPRLLGPVGGEENTAEILATREQTGGTLGVWRYTSTIPGGPPLHIHRAEDEFFYVLSGEFNFQLGDCIKRAPAGSFVFIPKDMVHTYQHVGPEPGVLLGTVHPAGFEGLFQGLPRADEATVRALFKKHRMEVVGPPIEAPSPPAPSSPARARGAQPPAKISRIGVLSPGCHPPSPVLDAFLQGLRDLGYIDGHNVAIEWRYSEGRVERFADLAAELVRLQVDLIVTVSTPAALAAKRATQTIPIVMVYVADPLGTGLVENVARPGANITGVTDMAVELSGKRLALLKEAVPSLSRVAVLWNAADQGMVLRFREIEKSARVLGLKLHSHEVRRSEDFERAFTAIKKQRPDALFVVAEVLTLTHRCRVLDFAATQRLPAMYEFGVFARDGGFMAYGPKLTETFQRGAYYVDNILKGKKPAELPVEYPRDLELVVNPETAKVLGRTFSRGILAQADTGVSRNRCTRVW
jgi:putative tryptophan/tyrosine transport system substrate-binding protein